MSVEVQIVTYWATVFFYVAGFVTLVSAKIFDKPKWNDIGFYLAVPGFVLNNLAILFRGIEVGHIPYWGIYEVFPNYAWGAMLFYMIVGFKYPKLRFSGSFLLPFAFIFIGIAVMTNKEIHEVPRTFYTYWLYVHVIFAKFAYGAGLVSAGMSAIYLYRNSSMDRLKNLKFWNNLPSNEELDSKSYRFAQFAFIMLGIMIVSGAIWAYKAWGRYWNWDPIETWALISWLVYGLYFHLRFTGKIKGKSAAWANLFAVVFLVFAFLGLPLFYDTVHEHLKYSL